MHLGAEVRGVAMTSRRLDHASGKVDGEPLRVRGSRIFSPEGERRSVAAAGTVLRLQNQPMVKAGQAEHVGDLQNEQIQHRPGRKCKLGEETSDGCKVQLRSGWDTPGPGCEGCEVARVSASRRQGCPGLREQPCSRSGRLVGRLDGKNGDGRGEGLQRVQLLRCFVGRTAEGNTNWGSWPGQASALDHQGCARRMALFLFFFRLLLTEWS